MLERQTPLSLEFPRRAPEAFADDRIERALGFVSAGLAAILDNMPLPRRVLSETTKALHVRVTLDRRAGWCPCCSSVRVCDVDGRVPGAEFDHYYGRSRNSPDETWLVCGGCNRDLELPAFKASVRSNFYAYQHAVLVMMAEAAEAQGDLFEDR